MPTNIRVIHAHSFIRATPEGTLDFEKTREIVLEIASTSLNMDDYDVILDSRKAQSILSVKELWHLATSLGSTFRQDFSLPQKTAVICPIERFNHAEFFALCAQNRGFNVGAFTSFEDAYEWLIENSN